MSTEKLSRELRYAFGNRNDDKVPVVELVATLIVDYNALIGMMQLVVDNDGLLNGWQLGEIKKSLKQHAKVKQ